MNIEGWNSSAVPPKPQDVVRAKMRKLLWDLLPYLQDEQDNDHCDVGNFDGGSRESCSHCWRQDYIDRIKLTVELDAKIEG
jgi:hypothetical protein